MADLLSILKMILEAGLKITSALEKADHNAEDCRRIRELLQTLSAIAKYQELEDNTVGDTTKGLEEALQRASKIVSKCERKTLVSRAFKANDIADKLRGVCIDILLNLNAVLLVNVVDIKKILTHNSSMLAKLLEICAAYPDVHLRRREMDRLVQTYRSSTDDARYQNKNKRKTKETDVARPEFKTEKDNTPVDSKVPRASLSDGSANSVKSVIGQGGPTIVNKAHSSNPTDGDGSSKKKKKEIKKVDRPNTTRPQVKIETRDEPADRKGPRASLSVRSAKSTSLKSVIGKGGPSIVNKIISRLTENMTAVTSIDGHPTKTWIVMSYEGGKVSIWDYQEKKTVKELQVNEVPGKFARLAHGISQNFKETGVPHSVCSAKFIAQGKWLVVGSGDGYIYVYAYTDSKLKLKEVEKFRAHDNSVDLLAVHPTKPYLLSSSAHGKTIKLWRWTSDSSMDWVLIRTFYVKPIYPDGVRSLKFNPRETNTFACVTYENKVKVGNIKNSSRLTTKLMGPFEADYCFSHSHLHLMVTLSPTSAEVQIWDLERRKVYHTLSLGGHRTTCVACHPTLPILVTTLDDGTVCFWDASTYRLEQTVHITDSRALDLVFIADINDMARLVVKFESMMVIMEVNCLPMENTSQRTDGGNYG